MFTEQTEADRAEMYRREGRELDRTLIQQYRDAKAARDSWADIVTGLGQQIADSLKDGDDQWVKYGLVDGERVLTYTRTEAQRFDAARLKRDYPDIHAQYLKSPAPTTSIRLAVSQ